MAQMLALPSGTGSMPKVSCLVAEKVILKIKSLAPVAAGLLKSNMPRLN